MTAPPVPTPRDHADEVHGLADRLGVSNEKLHHTQHERDRLRAFIVEVRGDHADNGSGYCVGDHAAMFVPFPCEVRDECDKALRPACKRCGRIAELFLSGWCGDCNALADDRLTVTCSRCGMQHTYDRDCVEDSFDPRDHDDRPGSDER